MEHENEVDENLQDGSVDGDGQSVDKNGKSCCTSMPTKIRAYSSAINMIHWKACTIKTEFVSFNVKAGRKFNQ